MMFEELVEFIGSQDGAAPKAVDPNAPPPSEVIGAMVPRIDGPLKTTGTARYASDYNFPGLAYAVPVRATVASGRVLRIDSTAAEENAGRAFGNASRQHHAAISKRTGRIWRRQQREPSCV